MLCPAPCPAFTQERLCPASNLQAFGACLQRTRLRTFLWTQPLLLAPMLWTGHAHCSRQLAAAPEAAGHVARIAATMRQASAWLPVGPLPGSSLRGGSGAAAAAVAAAETPQAACLAVHLWLVLVLSLCLPAIVIHRLEGQELQTEDERKHQLRQQQRGGASGGGIGGSARRGSRSAVPRQLLLQQPPSLLRTAAELLLAVFKAWQVVHVMLLVVDHQPWPQHNQ